MDQGRDKYYYLLVNKIYIKTRNLIVHVLYILEMFAYFKDFALSIGI